MRDQLVNDALAMAIASRTQPDQPLVAPPTTGRNTTSREYAQQLKDAGIAPSRGRTGTALDNAMAESVIATIKTELTKRRAWPTRLDLELALLTWIGFYNECRIHRSLDGHTPAEITNHYHQNHATDTEKTNQPRRRETRDASPALGGRQPQRRWGRLLPRSRHVARGGWLISTIKAPSD